ncbi:threonine ammonia-lyase [Candidatus Marsarchaeota G2 archaeon ECH_B_SAG-F08]|jgi:threonine dehydratase, medium form|uniref:threonine ammonia-lyase n=4 Tax=Candidatus Marsarchaeota TaxID=1978152 RepID=A0A2R6BYN9_9ARCH|nr:MAG: threonine ammonia-lyase [Candidatus Marsarchaeota G1 archaeon OSP_D]PSN89524.1 MAG: threonine ammonia-lyase [Candidatus Marsarchaeota G1 archaeon OSP_C]PSN97113.1 MAG: threonine ammonia-lyase [Candidatus Marsarchaeota G2 archaeon ECH_B_SAG-F08]PSO03743.1 MAG: threonine ammonia-lyase [Candidatus Marsarchaeota G2 archaeon ECH_B_SAG-G06]
MEEFKLTLEKVLIAQKRIQDLVHKTPLEFSRTLSNMAGIKTYLKEENLQRTGSFKIRGALNKIRALDPILLRKGVVAASAGNHAQGVSLASSVVGVKAKVFMPLGTPPIKIEATKSYGADVVLVGEDFEEAYDAAIQYCEKSGAVFIHPFDDEEVVAGQGTVALEILQDISEFDAVLVPIGGGGLISGIGTVIKTVKPSVKVIGVQAKGASSIYESFKQHKIIELSTTSTFAEGIATKKPSKRILEYLESVVDDIVLVDDEEIAYSLLLLMERAKLVAEGAGAASLAAMLFNKLASGIKQAVCVISGGNIDLLTLDRVLEKGLKRAGRRHRIKIRLKDRPGELNKVLNVLAKNQINILSIDHDRLNYDVTIGMADVTLDIETISMSQFSNTLDELKKLNLFVQEIP